MSCKKCGKCCMLFEIGEVKLVESKELNLDVYEDPWFKGQYFIKKHRPDWLPDWAKQGCCVYLGEAGKCTNYENRPKACREYTCRHDDGKLKSTYLTTRRRIPHPDRWTEYEQKMFGRFLRKGE